MLATNREQTLRARKPHKLTKVTVLRGYVKNTKKDLEANREGLLDNCRVGETIAISGELVGCTHPTKELPG